MEGVENDAREAYVAKRRFEATREGEDKPFGSYAANEAHNQLRRRGNKASDVPSPLTNKMMDSLEGYLNIIAAAATQTVAKGVPLAKLSTSLANSVDTVAAHQKEIKRL